MEFKKQNITVSMKDASMELKIVSLLNWQSIDLVEQFFLKRRELLTTK